MWKANLLRTNTSIVIEEEDSTSKSNLWLGSLITSTSIWQTTPKKPTCVLSLDTSHNKN